MSLLSRLAVQAARAYGILSSDKNRVSADYLVVAGGGGGGSTAGGGGGAGGFLTSTATLSTLNTYTITVGAGGSNAASESVGNTSGGNSVISGTGLTTITATGGGRGSCSGAASNAAETGGSGGGGGMDSTASRTLGAAGTSGQGNAGGNGFQTTSASNGAGGGGGGASAAGANTNGSGTQGGAGGAGTASSISGSSVTYSGGGGGGLRPSGTPASGGSGGGGTGGYASTLPSGGTANTGGGGGGGGLTASGAGGSGIVIISYTSATPKFVGGTITTSGGKQIHTFTSSGTLSPITPITASYLVVAGGAGGGYDTGGGGGAGGLLASSTTLYSGATYVVTVGAGGTGGTSNTSPGGSGSNSTVSGTGLTTITSTGGGGGGSRLSTAGASGGSGGGANGGDTATASGGAGTSGQGNNGGSVTTTSGLAGGAGGGGASAVGTSSGSGAEGKAGGAGTASSISGTSVTYAGGGGGGASSGGAGGAGGSGGGGAGGGSSGTGSTLGTPNTGGGGGGGYGVTSPNRNGGAGGSGIVIISYAGSQVFNGGLVTTSGGNTIHTFTSTGALTPLTNNLNNSLRFRSSASAYLNRTPTVAGNRKTWTWSGWIKLGLDATSSDRMLFSGTTNGTTTIGTLFFDGGSSRLRYIDYTTSPASYQANIITTSVYRDPSAWYHIVLAVDTTQATASNRFKFYVNGNQITSFDTAVYPSQNTDTFINAAQQHRLGSYPYNSPNFDGYMTDINFIDGQALEPYYFGNNDANGVWKPIQYKGTYGTNGFYLTFGNTTSTTTLGYDSSPNGNNWTCNNISLTAGVTYDAMTDVPTLTSATVANYCTLNPVDTLNWLSQNASMTLTNGNLTFACGAAGNMTEGTMGVSSGKWYFEITVASSFMFVGIRATRAIPTGDLTYRYYNASGAISVCAFNSTSPTNVATVATATTNGDIIGVAFDLDSNTISWYKNNTLLYTLTGVVPDTYAPATGGAATATASINFGQRPFAYTPPTGYVALNTYNLPTSTIVQGNKYMDATLYTGNGVTQVIVNQAQFQPDFVWVKGRSGATDNALYDSVRGTTKDLVSNSTAAETTQSTGLTAFNSNGFTVGALAKMNTSAATYVGWQWQAGQGSTSSNTSGSITSTVSVNTTAGFSVVTYTGTGANATVGHGLGVAPAMVIVKRRNSTGNWNVRHVSITAANSLYLNLTNASQSDPTVWNSTVPTSTVFSIGTDTGVNASGGTYVGYCWAEIAGFSKIGSYTGNGVNGDGPFVYCGFRPRFVMFKNTATAQNWIIMDTARDSYNKMTQWLFPNTSGAEYTDANISVDYLSNGFKIRTSTGTELNGNGNTIIFAAFAENPFKNANAR